MSEKKWDNVKGTIGKAANKLVYNVEKIGNKAVDKIYRKSIGIKLSEQYEKLGRLVYGKLKTGEHSSELTSGISAVMSSIAKLEKELTSYDDEEKAAADEELDPKAPEQADKNSSLQQTAAENTFAFDKEKSDISTEPDAVPGV